MEKFSKLVLISTLLNSRGIATDSKDLPFWMHRFISSLENDSHYRDSIMYRYFWNGAYYFQIEVPSAQTVFCQIINVNGEFLKWSPKHFDDFIAERSEETLIWEYNSKVSTR